MFHRLWQSGMIGWTRSRAVTGFMQANRAGSRLAGRVVAGGNETEGLARAEALMADHGIRASLFYLGDYIEDPDVEAENIAHKTAVAAALGHRGLDVHISVDPTRIGCMRDPAAAQAAAHDIAAAIRAAAGAPPGGNVISLDMEDSAVTDDTIALHDALAEAGLPAARTVQAHLRHTEADGAQIARGRTGRLVKGAFVEPADKPFTRRAEIKAKSRKLIARMLSPEARQAGFSPGIAAHDDRLHAFATETARKTGWPQGAYEFERLPWVCGEAARAQAAAAERVRRSAPFGKDWFPQALHRIGETPRNAWMLGRALPGAA